MDVSTQTGSAEALYRLITARTMRRPTSPVRDLLPPGDVDAAYAVQSAWVAGRVAGGARVVGRKIGLTNPSVQSQLGVDQPDFGALLDDMLRADGDVVDVALTLQPRIEAEIAFVLRRALGAGASTDDVRSATERVVPALEIVDSRIANWDITIVDTIADNASSALFVLGGPGRPLDDLDLRTLSMAMRRDGETVSEGTGAACLGDPIAAVVWLAEALARRGDGLSAGDVVMSGALGPVVPVRAGDAYEAEIAELGTVSVRFEGAQVTA